MALTPSTMLPLGTKAPDFALPDTEGEIVRLRDFDDRAVMLVMFICNHCPYVVHLRDGLRRLTDEYLEKGVGIVGISSNDAVCYPDDSPDKMRDEKRQARYQFAYLYDEDQSVAKAYQAACTPEFYVFNKERHLVYRGQFDGSRPANQLPVTGQDLRLALNAVLAGQTVSEDQRPSVGCNIKWKPGSEPSYFNR